MNKSESQQVAELYMEINDITREWPWGIALAALCASISSIVSLEILNSPKVHDEKKDEEKIAALTDEILQEICDKIRTSVLNTVRDVINLKHGVH